MADPLAGHDLQRQDSLHSVASNSSVDSGKSNLTRRGRTRARSKTLTGGSSARPNKLSDSPVSELPYLDKDCAPEPLADPSPRVIDPLSILQGSPHTSHRIELTEIQNGTAVSLKDEVHPSVISPYVEGFQSSPMVTRPSKQTSGLQILPTVSQPQPPPSAYSRDPSLTRINMAIRDSLSTQRSGVSSSIYPPSTSTTSGPDSPPSPRSMVEQGDEYDVPSYDPELAEAQEYDGDDVAYRLRLLVKNNYFLPPAHSKPSPSDLAPPALSAPKKPARSTTPAFMDIFRGRSKSKPTTPTGLSQGSNPNMPALRTTGDSIATSYVLRPQPRPSFQVPRHPPRPGDRSGRVVVVREKMQDLAVAAKQVEQDVKARGARLDSISQLGQMSTFNDIIDPTDAVDLPPPSSAYPFAVQASVLHGLGVQDSVGAALLADRLPPRGSNGISDPDDDWRKALLHEAVHHSLDSTSGDMSSFSMFDTSMQMDPLKPNAAGSPRATNSKQLLEQKIILNPRLSSVSPQLSRKESNHSQASASKSKEHSGSHLTPLDTSRTSYFPLRADTPVGPLTPLAPPPRRYLINPLYSLSQTELPKSNSPEQFSSFAHLTPPSVRKTVSSPMLSDAYESDGRYMMLTPPLPKPALSARSSLQGVIGTASFETSLEHTTPDYDVASDAHYSDDEMLYSGDMPRASITTSAMDEERPSFSEYSQASPTVSAFRDALNHSGYQSATSSHHQSPRISLEQQAVRDNPAPRYSAMSPPPRMSSSLAHIALPPPPRSSSFHYKAMASGISSISTPPISDPGHSSSNPLTDDTTLLIVAPEPTTPPFPISPEQRNPDNTFISPDSPPSNMPLAIHSTPGPSSPTSFFDTIQTQPNAMDDLDSSSGESDDDQGEYDPRDHPQFLDTRMRAISNASAQPRAPIMRLGNHSSPYISRTKESHRHSPRPGDDDSRKPIANTPVRAPFFTERSGKSDQGHAPPTSTYDFYKYTQQHRPASSGEPTSPIGKRRSATIGPVAEWRNQQRAQESLRKLDGMLIQHMETEKDTIKRIATSVRSNTATQNPNIYNT